MSYRFRNRGQKSDLQRVFEYINKQELGAVFYTRSIMESVGIPQNTSSASLAYLYGHGMLEKLPEKIRPPGRTYPMIVYKFAKRIDKTEHSKPIDHKRIVGKRKIKTPKPAVVKQAVINRDVPIIGTALLDLEKLKKISDALLNCCIELEIFMNEIKEAKNGKIQTSVCPAPQLPIRDGAPQENRE